MANYFWQGLSGATSAAMGTANSVFNAYDRLMKDQADAEFLNIRAKTQQDINVFLQDLSQRTDYDNFQKELDNFFTEKDNFYQKNAKNNYTAEKAHELMLGMRVDLKDRVQKKIIEGMRAEQLVMHENTMQINDSIYEGQERIDNNKIDLDAMYNKNLISSDEYNTRLKQLQANTVYDYYTQNANSYIDDAINNDMDVSYVLNKLDEKAKKDNVTFNVTSRIDGVIPDETKTAKAKAQQVIQEQYNLRVNELQKNNANKLSEGLTAVINTDNNTEKLNLAKEYLMMIDEEMKGKQLSNTDRDKYSKAFSNFLNDIEKELNGSGGTGGNGGNGGNAGIYAASVLFKNNKDSYIQQVIAGNISPETAKINLHQAMVDDLLNGKVKEYQGNNKSSTEKEADNLIKDYYLNYENEFYDELYDKIFKKPSFQATKQKIKNIINDIVKNPKRYTSGSMQYLSDSLVDFIISNDKVSDEEAVKFIDKAINATVVSGLQKLQYDKQSKDRKRQDYFEKALNTIEENDVIYGNKDGDVFFKSKEEQQQIENFNQNAKQEIALALGVEPTELRESKYIKDDSGDEIGIREFKYGDNTYHIEAVKNKNGKIVDYRIIDQNGNELEKYEKSEGDKLLNKQDRQNRQKIKEKMANVKTALKENADEKLKQGFLDAQERYDTLNNINEKPEWLNDVSKLGWKNADAEFRANAIENTLKNKKPPKNTNIKEEEWKNATKHERFKMLFN